jgi:hypothetical protein
MATTTGIQAYYSSAFKVLPQKAIPLGTPSSVYEPLTQTLNEAGTEFIQYFSATIPVGFGWASTTNFDYLNIASLGGNYSNSANNTVVPGLRIKRMVMRCSAAAGNTVLSYVGFAVNNNLVGTGSALQGGAVSGTPIAGVTGSFLSGANANVMVCDVVPSGTGVVASDLVLPVLTTADTLVLAPIAAVNLTTTITTLTGYVEYYLTGPTGF